MEKKCKGCGEVKEFSAFYKLKGNSDGLSGKCKECIKARVRENRALRVDQYREYDRKRFQEDPRVKERHLRYQKTDAGKKSMNKSKKKWIENNKEKRKTHHAVNNAVRDGKLIKPKDCQVCGKIENRIHGHHENYDNPLDVIWVCSKCHTVLHKNRSCPKVGGRTAK